MNQQVDARARRDIDVLRDELINMSGQFEMALPKHIPVDRFVRVAMTAIQNMPDLMKCDRRSLWNAFMKCAQDGLLPDSKEAVILPFNTKVKEQGKEIYKLLAQYIPMIAGIRKKARNSGEISDWYAEVIHQRDEWDYQRGDDQHLHHRPNLLEKDRGPIIAAYAVCLFKDGFKSIEAMSIHEIERIRAMSKSPNGPGWSGHFAEMCKKTVARRHSKILPTSTDLDDLLRRDDEVHGSADFAEKQVIASAERPRLVDFTGSQPEQAEATSDDAKPAEESKNKKSKSQAQEDMKPKQEEQQITGQSTDARVADEPMDQDQVAQDFEQGRKDFAAGKMYPPLGPLREDQTRRNAWQAGWDKAREEKAPGK